MKKSNVISIIMIVTLVLSLFAGCSNEKTQNNVSSNSSTPKKAESGQLSTVYDNVLKEVFGEQMPTMMKNEDAALIKEMFSLDVELAKEFIVAMPMMNVQVNTFIGVEAKEGKAADVEKALNAYKEKFIVQKEEFAYVDFGLEKARGAQVIVIDDYVFYIGLANSSNIKNAEGVDVQKLINDEIEKAVKSVKNTLAVE